MSNNIDSSSSTTTATIATKKKQGFTNQKSCPAFFSTSCHGASGGVGPCYEMEPSKKMENNNLNEAKEPPHSQCQEVHCSNGSRGHLLVRHKSFDYYLHPTVRNSLLQLRKEEKLAIQLLPAAAVENDDKREAATRELEENEAEEKEEEEQSLTSTTRFVSKMSTVEAKAASSEESTRMERNNSSSRIRSVCRSLIQFWRSWIILGVPLVALPLLFQDNYARKEASSSVLSAAAAEGGAENEAPFKCAYVMVIMATFWVTEALPLAITSLLPVALLPLLGIMTTDDVGREYLKETNMMFISGVMVAIAVEQSNLHRRVALKALLTIGTSPRRLMLGFMIPTAFLSMWISNTATTAMMVPIVDAVLSQLERDDVLGTTTSGAAAQGNNLRHMIFLSIAYAANTGGTGTLTGTGSNLILKGALDEYGSDNPVNFASWMQYAAVPMIINFLFCWIWLQFWYLGWPKTCKKKQKRTSTDDHSGNSNGVRDVIRQQYKELGPMDCHQIGVLVLFITLIFLWFFRKPQFMMGWSDFFKTKSVHFLPIDANCKGNCTYIKVVNHEAEAADDATAGMIIVILLFIIPSSLNFWPFVTASEARTSGSLLSWQAIHQKMPWSLVFLLGGGFALAKACSVSGLSALLGQQLEVLDGLPRWVMVLVLCLITAGATEVTSNVATCSILLPVLKNLAVSLKIHPVYLLCPVTLACSYAFMLPVATPPNAIVYSASGMSTSEMMKLGLGMNIICVAVNVIWLHTFGSYFFQLDTFPQWAAAAENTGALA